MTLTDPCHFGVGWVILFWYLLGPGAALSYLIAWALATVAEAALEEPVEIDP